MPTVRLLADDLTGALDTAARLLPIAGPIGCVWDAARLDGIGSFAFDTATREAEEAAAARRVGEMVPHLARADIAFKKIDSLLRGHVAAELAACWRSRVFAHVVLAPAFPAQGRITRDSRQWVTGGAGLVPCETDLALDLGRHGLPFSRARSGTTLAPAGITVWDAATEADLQEIVAASRRLDGPVLWCGTAGLAAALGGPAVPAARLEAPLLGLFGSNHVVTREQLARADRYRMTAGLGAAPAISARLAKERVCLVDAAIDPLDPADAKRQIAMRFGELVADLPRPASLIVTGGETLRDLADALGATRIELEGELSPGLPTSRFADGRWVGLRILSKSGAFGDPDLLLRLAGEVARKTV